MAVADEVVDELNGPGGVEITGGVGFSPGAPEDAEDVHWAVVGYIVSAQAALVDLPQELPHLE